MKLLGRKPLFARPAVLLWVVVSAFATAAHSNPEPSGNLLFILDASGSMWGQIESRPKIVIAKEVMGRLVSELPESIRAGLQAYGHRSKSDCDDIELLVPVGDGNRQRLLDAIESLKPRGKTPITQAFEQAAERLRALEEETTVVLVSDGKETCDRDPCTLVRELRAQGIRIQVHVVGFDVGTEEREQLVCIAEAGGGQYFSAQNADQLTLALSRVKEEVIRKAEVKPAKKVIKLKRPANGTITVPNLDGGMNSVIVYELASGKEVATLGSTTNSTQLPPGEYRLELHGLTLAEVGLEPGATVESRVGTISIPNLDRNDVRVYELASGKETEAIHSHIGSIQLPPGAYRLELHGLTLAEVELGQDTTVESRVGRISIPNFEGIRNVVVFEQASGREVGWILATTKTLDVAPGIYKLEIDGMEIPDVAVEAGQEIVLE